MVYQFFNFPFFFFLIADQQGKLDSIAVSEYFSKELENTNMASQVCNKVSFFISFLIENPENVKLHKHSPFVFVPLSL